MEDPFLSWLNLFLALALIALNGFFVAAEFALVRVRESRIQQLGILTTTSPCARSGSRWPRWDWAG